MKIPAGRKIFKYSQPKVAKPKTDEDLAFLPVTHLAQLLKNRTVKSIGPDQALPRAAQEIRSDAPLRRHPDRGARPQAGGQGRRRDRRRKIPRPAPRHPLGREGPPRGQGIQDDVRRLALQGPDDRRRFDRLHPADRGRGGPRRQADPGRAGHGRPLVRRPDQEPLGPGKSQHRIERFIGRPGLGHGRRAASGSPSGPKRAARSCPRRAAAGTPACGRRSAGSAATGRWP